MLTFDDKFYKQKFGTAMGTPMAPSIANIFMYWLESSLLGKCIWEESQETWKRYIDDIILFWLHSEDELTKSITWINALHPTIKFTAEYGRDRIPYLDVSLSIVEITITTDLHMKATLCLLL